MIDSEEKGKERLNHTINEEITKLFEKALDYAQVACPTNEIFKILRSKILRVGNNCIRSLEKELNDYDVVYSPKNSPLNDLVIEIRHKKSNLTN